ncbi:4-hydroxy-tetrahydrodipicolinate reductase [Nostoc sp. C117]|uniref:4-hydroxy-tetrahydrodipicolinate reductase n=1 Tax=Nostoc sp. C117 TaxID=3349875 RepID=UPI00370DD93F
MPIDVCLAGVTGWVGQCLVSAISTEKDLNLVGGVSRTYAGKRLNEVLMQTPLNLTISGSVKEALKNKCDVLVDYTKPNVVKSNVLEAIQNGIHVVIGTSGLTDEDFAQINEQAIKYQVGVLAAGNFAITAVLLQRFAEMAAKYIPYWEILDYANEKKVDAPSGTARELASRLGQVQKPILYNSIEETQGSKESRGATLNGTQVHSLRLPGYTLSVEVIFGLLDEKLIIRHEAGSSAEPYVKGTLLAIRQVSSFIGLKRGLDSIMEF